MLGNGAPYQKNRTESEGWIGVILIEDNGKKTPNTPFKVYKQGTAIYRTVRTVVWEVETGTSPVSPTRLWSIQIFSSL